MTTVNNILNKFEGSLEKIQTEDFREFLEDMRKQIKDTNMYWVHDEVSVGPDDEITREIMVDAEDKHYTQVLCCMRTDEMRISERRYRCLKSVINDDSEVLNTLVSIGYNGMDEANKKAADVLRTGGIQKAIEHMFTREDGTPMTYGEMRSIYG